ncbi:metal-dependent transcriptional regulator [Slackia heliotrinireducens]|uniref:metal-dependent transcriptional regulator n=1 Tax=Slackia heliotrinireducens TaxID=84110 RepID=UPI003314969B
MTELQTETMLESRQAEGLSHSLEDYLEAIVDLAGPENNPIRAVDLAKKLDVSKASVSKAISNLKDKGFADQPYYGDITLTEEGLAYGRAVWHKHKLLFRFLNETIGIDPETANYEACQMEHTISSDSFKKWEAFLATVGIGEGE